jgi:MFS family permease
MNNEGNATTPLLDV